MYHHIGEDHSHSSLAVRPQSFERQFKWLQKKGFDFLSLDKVIQRSGWASWGERSVALTFDDGFRDNYENAFSLLLSHGKTAALFVVVDWVGQSGFLNWGEIRELSDAGITIASHSLSHRWLPDLTDNAELEREIFDSKKKIEDQTGREVHWFCYPVGGVDQRVSEYVKKAGYRAAWVAGGKPSYRIEDPLLCLRRVKISPSDSYLFRFAVKAYGVKNLLSP